MRLSSKNFQNDDVIPKKCGYKHGNISPQLQIDDIPQNTISMALIMDDPDAKKAVGKVWVHWILYNLPPDVKEIHENPDVKNFQEGINDFNEIGYGGPAPPDEQHTYIFKLFALDSKLESDEPLDKKMFEEKILSHVIDETILKGKYSPQ